MDKLGWTGSRAQWINGAVLLSTFAGSRLLWGTYQTFNMFRDIWNVYQGSSSGLPVPPWLALTYVAANTTLCALNFYWFGRMVETVTSRFRGDKDEKGLKKE